MSRKICYVIANRVHYARGKKLLKLLKNHPDVELQIVLAGTACNRRFGDIEQLVLADGHTIEGYLHSQIDGGKHVDNARTLGLMALDFSSVLQRLKPDIVVVRGDRFEMLGIAASTAMMHIPIAHIEGGDLSGTIDESVRHAITKLAHIHFPTNEASAHRIVQIGEDPTYVFNVGSLDLEMLMDETVTEEQVLHELHSTGTGSLIDLSAPFSMVMQHPVTTDENFEGQIVHTIEAVNQLNQQAYWFWPNADAGTEAMTKKIREYHERYPNAKIQFLRNVSPEAFAYLLKRTQILIGNSSAGIKEASYFGTPVVNIGSRQQGRLEGTYHILSTGYSTLEILEAIKTQIAHGKYEQNRYYLKENPSERITHLLTTLPLYIQKRFHGTTSP